MRFFKLLKYDFLYGITNTKNIIKFIIYAIIVCFGCWQFRIDLIAREYIGYSLGDYFLYVFGGIKEYIPSPNEPFRIPYLFLLIHILILYLCLHYAHDDLEATGIQIIYRVESRIKWWLSKCVWCLLYVLTFYMVSWLIILMMASINGCVYNFTVSDFMRDLIGYGPQQLITDEWDLFYEVTLMPFLVTLALSILQMALSLVFKPAFAFIFSSVMLISSAYYMTPYLIGNFAMAVRSDKVVSNGLNLTDGIIAAIGMIIIGIIIGALAIRRYNVLSKE